MNAGREVNRPETPPRRRVLRGFTYVLAMLLGFALAVFVLVNPFDLTLLDTVSLGFPGHRVGTEETGTPAGTQGLWTCGMHPQVIQDRPGMCPICGINLVPVRGGQSRGGATPAAGPSGERRVLFYRNPMDPAATSPVPMKDEMGMDYLPVYEEDARTTKKQGPVVTIDPAVVQNMGVTTEKVSRRNVTRRIRTVGYLDYDQEKMVSITTKYDGFVEKVYVNYLGQPVRRGEALFEIYAPELVQTEQELLSAVAFARRMQDTPEDPRRRAEALVEAARKRLSYWDITADQVARLEETATVFRTLTVTAPVGGVVMKRMAALEGMAVRPGMDLIHIADLSSLWLKIEVYEDQLPWLKPGSPASVTLDYFPGKTFNGHIRFVEPAVSAKTRTVNLTLQVPNPDRRLRSGMYATVEFEPLIVENAIAIPSYAVLRTGRRNIVVVALGAGRFAPRTVELGPTGDGRVQVLSGLEEGDEIVTSSQFLIDSESNLHEAVQKMIAGLADREP